MLVKSIIALLVLLPTHAFAFDTWLCEDSTGRRYQVSQNVPSDSCKKLEDHQMTWDPASIELPKRSNPKWGIEAFCAARKTVACETSDNALELGALDGTWFRLSEDSASVAGAKDRGPDSWTDNAHWRVNCSRDKMSSRRSCMINKDKGDLYVFVSQGGGVSVSVGYEHFPGSQTSIKIGAKRFDTRDRDGDFGNSAQLVRLMRDGTSVVTRYMKWPYQHYLDDDFVVYGLGTSVTVANWLIKNGDIR